MTALTIFVLISAYLILEPFFAVLRELRKMGAAQNLIDQVINIKISYMLLFIVLGFTAIMASYTYLEPLHTFIGNVEISEETSRALTKIKGEITARTGKDVTYDEVITELIRIEKQKNNESNSKT